MSEISYVYMIQSTDPKAIKIGRSDTGPEFRLRTMQTGCPSHLHLLGYWILTSAKEARRLEGFLHRAFWQNRTIGEWFAGVEARDIRAKVDDSIAWVSRGKQGVRHIPTKDWIAAKRQAWQEERRSKEQDSVPLCK